MCNTSNVIQSVCVCVVLMPQWEKSENKPIVVGYVAAALFAFYISEWLIHLPGLNYVSAGAVSMKQQHLFDSLQQAAHC